MESTQTNTKITDSNESEPSIWMFRFMVLIPVAIMLVSWFLPWWTIDIEGFADNAAQIRPWGLELCGQMGGFAILMKGTEMPAWFGSFMWAFLGLCMLAILVGLFVRGKEYGFGKLKFNLSQILIGGVGVAYLACGIFAAVYAGMRMKNTFDVPLVGRAFIDMGDPLIAYVDTYLLPGYYLIFVAGILFVALGLTRNKITALV